MDEKLLIKEVNLTEESNQMCLNEITEIRNDLKNYKSEINKTVDNCFEHIEECNKKD